MKTFIQRFKWLLAFALLISMFQLTPQLANAEGNKPLSLASGKDIISFGGKQWILLNPSSGYMILKDHEITREFDPMYTQLYDPTDSDNLAYYLNNDFYNSLSNKEWIEYKNWTIGNEKNESANSVWANVGLISREELTLYQTQFGYIPVPSRSFWTRTPGSARSDLVYAASQFGAGSDVVGAYNTYFAVRPTVYLKPGLYVTSDGQITNIYGSISSKIVAPYPNQVFSEADDKKFLAINGTTVADAGVTNTVKYTIDGLSAHTNQTIQTFVANGTNQEFRKDITVDHTFPKGTYTLRVWNEDGGGKKYQEVTTTFIIGSSNKDLGGLSLSTGELSPGFDPAITSYSASVTNNVTSIIVTPTVADAAATVEVNGASTTSGQSSAPISLNPGGNTITVQVKAQDGTQKNYTVTVTRTANANNNLSGLSLSSGTLGPAFDPAVTIYSTNVGNNVTSITVTPTVEDVTATLQVNGASLASGQASTPINLYVGNNTITVRVMAQDGTPKDYTLTVRRVPSSNNNLSALSLSSGSLSPAFDPGVISYSTSVANNVTSIALTPTVADKTAMVEVNGESAISGQASTPIGLNVGENTITVRVRAQDGSQKNYTITVTRISSSNNNLSGLSLLSGTLNPGFDSAVTSYTASVANNVTTVTVTPTVADGAATLEINGASATNGQASAPISLNVGSNTITVRVTAQDGTQKNYTITVTRAVSSINNLSALSLSNGTINPGFDPAVTSYSATVANNVTSFTVTPTVADGASTVQVNGADTTSGQASTPISLNTGSNTITVRVTAQDGTPKDYTISVKRQSGNADLSDLTVDGTSVAGFDPGTLTYTINVPNATTSVTVAGTAADANANVSVTGGGALNVGDNTVTLKVTAEDTTITMDYTITVRRQSSNADLSTLTVDGTSVAGFDPGTLTYAVTVPNATTLVTVAGTAADANANVSVTGGGALNVGDNTVTVRVTAEDTSVTNEYTISIHRQSGNTDLSDLTVDGTSVAGFDPGTLTYTINVPNATTSVTVAGTAADANANVSVTGGGALNVGDNTVTLKVTAEDTTITMDYTITVRRQSSNADLSTLTVDGTSVEGFDPVTLTYAVTVPNATTLVTVAGTAADANANVSVTGGGALNVGDNTVTVRVTAEDTSITKEYTIIVHRQSGNADLSDLTMDGTSVAGFDSGTLAYNVIVPNSTTAVTVAGTAVDTNATVNVMGGTSLDAGDNTVTVRVTAEDTVITKEYTITVHRQSGNADLSALTVDGTSVTDFDPATLTYTVTVPNATTSVSVAGTAEDQNASVSVTGENNLHVGDNTVTVSVIAEDTTITKNYTIIVHRQSGNADLSDLTMDGTSVAGFDSGTLAYNVIVPNSTTAVTVAGTAVDTNATVNVMGGTSLDAGDNTVTVRVTAEDTVITKEYTITVHRQSGNADLSALTVDGTSVTDFDPATLTYTVTVPNATTSVSVAGTAEDQNASVSVTGENNLHVGDNTVTVSVIAEDTTITKNYMITVVRAASSNSNLSSLTLSTGNLSPSFDSDTTSYKASVEYSVTSLTVTPTTADSTASVEVNQVGVTSGQVSSDIKLNVGNNTIDVTVTAQDSSKKSYTIQVRRQSEIPPFYPVTSVSLDETKLTLKAGGKTAALQAIITPSYATNQSVNWSSRVPEVASVDQNGVVTPHKEGETIITVTTVDGHFTAESIVKVEPEQKPEPEVKVEVLKASKPSLLLKPGKSSSIKVFAVYSDGKEKDITRDKKTSFQSSSDTGATVTKGVIKAGKKEGEVTITISYEDQVLQIPVTISKVSLEELLIPFEQIEMEIGEDIRPQVTAKWLDDSQDEVTNQVQWKSDTPEVVVIENGKLVAKEAGTAKVTAYYGGKSVELLVKVKEPRNIKRISVNKQAVKMAVEKTQAITLTVYYKDGSKQVVTEKAEWSSADESIATVEDGKITAIGKGVTTVTVKYRERKLTIRVTVTE
ncbi:cadherin-like beta sandwich domain-containing protein [Brevibacillus sp. SYSU BS000544]|uniref:cadherin-like beta sandwich domain-containing protein n=1 Tax=Brevibacillus sp. SYSU BS000544 TaxID=3416443 RepID=UPI003CE4EF63